MLCETNLEHSDGERVSEMQMTLKNRHTLQSQRVGALDAVQLGINPIQSVSNII